MAKYEMKLYTTFDADLISLNAAGISVPKLIRIALEHRVRGKRARFFVNGCIKYNLNGRKRKVHTSVTINDRKSIEFLEKELKPRTRSAFFKLIVREALINQPVGVYLKNDSMINREDFYIKRQDVGEIENLFIFNIPKKRRNRDYAREILYPSDKEQEEEDREERYRPGKNRFGDVEDLSFSAQQKKNKKKTPAGGNTAETEPVRKEDSSTVMKKRVRKEEVPAAGAEPVRREEIPAVKTEPVGTDNGDPANLPVSDPYGETGTDAGGGYNADEDEDAKLFSLFVGMDS